MLKKIILSIFIRSLLVFTVSAKLDITISSDLDNVQQGNNFTFNIEVVSDTDEDIKIIDLGGVDKFQIKSQSHAKNISLIGDINEVKTQVQYILQTTRPGKVKIGPLKIESNGEIATSNAILINILSLQDLSLDDLNTEAKDEPNIWSKLLYYPSLLVAILFFIASVIYFVIKSRNTQVIDENDIQEVNPVDNILYDLKELERLSDKLDSNIFYAQFNVIFRKYLIVLGIQRAGEMTLSEIKKLDLNTEILSLFTLTYNLEFSNSQSSIDDKNTAIDTFRKIITK